MRRAYPARAGRSAPCLRSPPFPTAQASFGPVVAAGSCGEQQPCRECRLGDDAGADATRPRQAPATQIDGIQEGDWCEPGRTLPRGTCVHRGLASRVELSAHFKTVARAVPLSVLMAKEGAPPGDLSAGPRRVRLAPRQRGPSEWGGRFRAEHQPGRIGVHGCASRYGVALGGQGGVASARIFSYAREGSDSACAAVRAWAER